MPATHQTKQYIRIYRKLKRLNSAKINDPMKKWSNELNRAFSKEEVQMVKKIYETIFTIPGHIGNADQNLIKIPLYFSQNNSHQEYK
jgi:hypothetical protein